MQTQMILSWFSVPESTKMWNMPGCEIHTRICVRKINNVERVLRELLRE